VASRVFFAISLAQMIGRMALIYAPNSPLSSQLGPISAGQALLMCLITPYIVMGKPKPGDAREWPRAPAVAFVVMAFTIVLNALFDAFGLYGATSITKSLFETSPLELAAGFFGTWIGATVCGAGWLVLRMRGKRWRPIDDEDESTPSNRSKRGAPARPGGASARPVSAASALTRPNSATRPPLPSPRPAAQQPRPGTRPAPKRPAPRPSRPPP
jgi:uncharacterized membrane protein